MSAFLLEEKRLLRGQAGKAGQAPSVSRRQRRRGSEKWSIRREEYEPKAKSRDICPKRTKKSLPQQTLRAQSLYQLAIWTMRTPSAGSALSRRQGAMHRGGHRGSGDILTSPQPTSPRMLRQGPSSAGTSLGCQATPKPHPFKAEKETAGSTRLHVTRVTQASRPKLHTLQVTFDVMGGGLSEAV